MCLATLLINKWIAKRYTSSVSLYKPMIRPPVRKLKHHKQLSVVSQRILSLKKKRNFEFKNLYSSKLPALSVQTNILFFKYRENVVSVEWFKHFNCCADKILVDDWPMTILSQNTTSIGKIYSLCILTLYLFFYFLTMRIHIYTCNFCLWISAKRQTK